MLGIGIDTWNRFYPAAAHSHGILTCSNRASTWEGAVIVLPGVIAGVLFGLLLARVASSYLGTDAVPGVLPVASAAAVLTGAAVIASLIPAARASRVDVLRALRSE